ncbi:MAG TPA: hypothetical protein DCE41_07410, partial [Cytophagales bacterium]|nr:hypothetical protein [Cytophagales bacterium]
SETLADIANYAGNYQLADDYRQRVLRYQEQLAREDLQLLRERFNFQLQAAEARYEKEQQATRYERWLVAGVALGIFLILTFLLGAWYKMQRSREAHQENILRMIQEQNHQLEEKVEERTLALREKNTRLNHLSRYKEELTHMIAHDLKNPLNIILGLSEDPKWGRKSQSIKEAGQMMLQMVTNMLDVQKFEEAKMQLEARHLRLHDLVSKAAEQVGLLVQAKSLSLKNEVDPTHVIHGDEGLLIRIFLNLFTNAIKYCDPGGQIRVEALTLTGGRIEVSVQDDGQGMDAESRKHVFDKYFQAKARKSGKTRSTGLGLTFCQMAIEAHQGSIRVDSATHL